MRTLKSLTLGVLVLLFCLSNVAEAQADTVERLINQLKNENWRVQGQAADALGKIGDPRAVEPLVGVLKDKDWRVRKAAAEALGNIGDSRAVEPLIAALKDKDSNVRYNAAIALGEIGDPRAVGPLIAALKDEDRYVREIVMKALTKIGDPRAVEPLIAAALKDEYKFVRKAAVEALEKLDWKPKNETKKLSYLIAKQDWDGCVEIGKPAVEPLITALKDGDWRVRKAAAEALGKIGDSRAVEPLIATLKDKNWFVRYEATKALGKIGDSRAVEPLAGALKDKDSDVRGAAAEALEKLDWKAGNESEKVLYLISKQDWNGCVKIGKPAVEPLTTVLKDKDWRVREAAAEALGKIGDSRAVEPLVAALKDKRWRVRERAAEALGETEDSRAVEPLAGALKDKDWRVRGAGAEALGKIGDPRAVEPLAGVLKDKDNDVRKAGAEALGNIGDSRAVEPLATVLKDGDWRVRGAGAEALGKIGDPRVVEPLAAALKDEKRYVQYKAAKALDKLGRKAKNESEKAFYLLFAEDISEILRKRIKVYIGKFGYVSRRRFRELSCYDPPAKIPYYSVDGIFLYTLKANLISEGYEVIENEGDNYEIKIGGVIKAETKTWTPIRMQDILTLGVTRVADSFPPFIAKGIPKRDYVKIQVTVNYSINNKVIKKRYIQAVEKPAGSRRYIVQELSQRISSKMIEDLKKFQR